MSTQAAQSQAGSPTGITTPTASGGRNGFLSDVIVELGFASRETVEQAVRAARSPGTTVARVLVDTNAISEEQLARATAERYGIDYIDLDGFDVDPAAANLIKPTAARRYQAVPVGFLGKGLLVAMADPADALGVNDIAVMTKLEVRPAVASRPALDALLEALPLDEWGHEGAHGQRTEAGGPPSVEEAEIEAPAPEPPASSAVFWQDGAGDSLPAPPEPPADSDDASRLREELTALKAQLASAEARLADAGQGDHRADDSEVERLRAELADAEAERDEARTRAEDVEDLRERVDSVEAERDEARERTRDAETELRRIRASLEVRSGELETLRGTLADAETELARVRSEVDTRGSELEAMRTRAESAEAEAESALRCADQSEREVADAQREVEEAQRTAADAQREVEEAQRTAADAQREVEEARRESSDAQREAAEARREAAEARREAAEARREAEEAAGAREEARQLTEELEAADARSEQARRALAELRAESEREREQWAMAERDLRATLAEEECRRSELEQRLSEVEGSAFAAERAFEELRLAQGRMRGALRALADPGNSESSDDD